MVQIVSWRSSDYFSLEVVDESAEPQISFKTNFGPPKSYIFSPREQQATASGVGCEAPAHLQVVVGEE